MLAFSSLFTTRTVAVFTTRTVAVIVAIVGAVDAGIALGAVAALDVDLIANVYRMGEAE